MDRAETWDRAHRKNGEFPDPNLASELLAMYPRSLPEVYLITDENRDEVSVRSEAFRKKLIKRAKLRAAKKAE
jgi:hypothetical protein